MDETHRNLTVTLIELIGKLDNILSVTPIFRETDQLTTIAADFERLIHLERESIGYRTEASIKDACNQAIDSLKWIASRDLNALDSDEIREALRSQSFMRINA